MSDRSGIHEIWRMPAGGGRAEQITNGGGLKAWESRDGRFVYYSTSQPAPAIWRVATSRGEPELVFRLPAETPWGGEWILADNGIYWVNGKASPRTGHRVLQLCDGSDHSGGHAFRGLRCRRRLLYLPDGRWLVFGQRDYQGSDIMMIEGFE